MARKGEPFRRLDNLGRIVIPVEMRRLLGLDIGDEVAIEVHDGGVLIKAPLAGPCPVCGNKRCA